MIKYNSDDLFGFDVLHLLQTAFLKDSVWYKKKHIQTTHTLWAACVSMKGI